jgi:hypothetical protein
MMRAWHQGGDHISEIVQSWFLEVRNVPVEGLPNDDKASRLAEKFDLNMTGFPRHVMIFIRCNLRVSIVKNIAGIM